MPVVGDVTAGGNWGSHGFNIAKASAENPNVGILYDNYTATAGTYVFKTSVRAVAGNPTVGVTTVKSYVPTYDVVYGKAGFAPSAEWEDYKAILTPAEDVFTVSFGVMDGKVGDVLGWNPGDGVYYAPEVAYDVAVEIADEKKTLFAGATKTLKAEVLNQIGIKAHSADQSFLGL